MAAPKKRGGPPPAYLPAEYTDRIVYAIRALVEGKANEGQQMAAIEWIVKSASNVHDLHYRPGGDDGRRETDFALGRAFVGRQILKMLEPEVLAKTKQ